MRRPASTGNLWRSSRATASLLWAWLSEAAGRGASKRREREREREGERGGRNTRLYINFTARRLYARVLYRAATVCAHYVGAAISEIRGFVRGYFYFSSRSPPPIYVRYGRIPGCRLDQRSLVLSSFCILPSRLYGDETYEIVFFFLRIVDILLLRRIWILL